MEQLLIIGMIGVIIAGAYWMFYYKKKSTDVEDLINSLNEKITNLGDSRNAVKKTLLKGLFYRFNKEGKYETPLDFENFVASIFEKCYGGSAAVTKGSGEFGVDIEHSREGAMYLGQVKCYEENNKVGFEPIAIIHSQMIKQNALRGFVVTTSDFTPNAREYAEDLDIDLINGNDFIEMWISALQEEVQESQEVIPQEAY